MEPVPRHDPAMTPIERQMQVIATSIQDLARETSRQNQELWQAIRKGPPTPHDNNQPPPRGGNGSNDQEADSHQVTRRRGGEVERTPHRSRHRAESAGSSAPPSQHKTAKTTRSSKQPERPDRSFKQPERQDRRGSSSRRPDHPAQSSKEPDDKTTRLEKELREMRKQMGDMKNSLRAKAARNLDNLVHRVDSPFIPSIADFPLPSRFKVPLLENFDGTKDPFDYLEAFKTIMQLQAVPEEVMCRAFPLGLRGSARVWFNKLESESIGSFVQLSRAFIDHFIGSQRRGRPPTHLLSVKQMEGESLRTFVHRFNEEAMKIDRPKEDVTVTAFMAGLRKGDFLYELCKDPPETMSELMYEATKHMNAEDALEAMDDPPPKRRKETEDRKPKPAKQKVPKFTETPERKRTTAPPVKFSSLTPLNTPIDKLLLQIQDDPSLRWLGKIRSDPNNRPKNLYCRFHRDHGHLTEDCVALKEQVETLIRQGKLQKYVSRPANASPAKPSAQRGQAKPNRPGPVGEIRTIIGGPASGGTSRASRKAYARQVHNIMVVQRPLKNVRLDDQIISFSEEDARGTHQPHDDALVITVNIAAYQQMRLDKDKLCPMDAPLVGFTGDKVCPVGIVTLPITVGTHSKTVSKTVDFLVVNCPSAYNAIIGRPTLNRLRAVTSTYHLLLKFPTEHGIGEVRGDQVAARECYLASLGSGGQNQTMTIEEQKILVKPSGELDTIELEDGRPERTTKVGADLPPKMKESLVQFLKENKDVFAWSHEDMPGINPSIISHKLNVDPSLRPIKQKRRVFAPERNNAIMEEVDKLLTANFIREVFYPDWLANVVMVKKSTGKWRMCVDFTDLNKACPKDSFPLPRIDQLVDSTAGHKLLTFMDAFSGYNQIVMDESDQEKTSFITSRGLFCYKVMSFGLKNAGATYQRLMNRMFHDQIGRNVEVYVDDMLVKSKEEDVHLDDLRETFQTLRKYQMKLNPSKCAFGVYSGKFLGFMVSQRGIEANPDKIKAILEMQPPKSTKEVQRLTGRVAALNRFMSRSTDKCLPFFKTLKKAFEWIDECQQAFEELKRYLTEPPLLSPSKQGEELYLYLAVSPTAVSSALIREEERRQLPVYYTSRALRGAEERYPLMKKLAFALVTATRKLRPYFQAHTIVLLTNHPLRKAMNKPDAAGRLIQWSIELSEFDIDYRPRTAIKAQALADFIAEFTSKDDEPTEDVEQTSKWTMNIDGSSTKDSGGIGVVLRSPKGDTIKQAVRLQYPTTNNEAEYEALLTGLEMAKALGATELEVLSDSQLVVGQVNGDYEAKEGRMQQADQLAKSASSSTVDDQIKVVQQSSLQATEMNPVHVETSWMTPIISYLQGGTLPDNRHEARRLKVHEPYKGRSSEQVTIGHSCKLTPADSSNTEISASDIMGPFPIGRRQLKFLIVAIDYFTKWVEAEPLATITEKNVQNFVWKAVISRFGIPRVLVSDNGKQFDNPRFRQFSQELGIHNHYSSPGHPQANGQVEVTNRSLLKLIKTRLEGAKGLWPEELPSILWAYRTTVIIPTGETLFQMTFGSEAVVLVEIGMTTLRTSAYDDQQNEEQLRLNLDLIDEVRETAETRMKRYQEKMARHYNSKVKPRQLSVGDLVLRKVTLATKNPSEGKLGPNWEGPYKVIEIRRPGTYHLEDMDGQRLPHLWNAEHLRKYYP
uniref:Integrase catalytic domain-containing protein n=1 Tax=Fagus sylvatica TaxID=28930 RepID=A0A2N9H0S8_FAGSY